MKPETCGTILVLLTGFVLGILVMALFGCDPIIRGTVQAWERVDEEISRRPVFEPQPIETTQEGQ